MSFSPAARQRAAAGGPVVLFSTALVLGTYLAARALSESFATGGRGRAAVGLLLYAAIVAAGTFVALRLNGARNPLLIWPLRPITWPFGLGMTGGAAIVLSTVALLVGSGWARLDLLTAAPQMRVVGALAGTLPILLVIAFNEELVFRAVLPWLLGSWLGPAPAVVLAAGAFAAVHMASATLSWFYLPSLFIFGLLAAALFRLTGSLWAPIGLHFAWDYVSFALFLGRGGSAHLVLLGPRWLAGAPDHLSAGFAMTAMLAIGAGVTALKLIKPSAASR